MAKKTDTMELLIIRGAAIGDVLCTEPIVRKLTQMGYRVHIKTKYPEIFVYNSSLTSINKSVKTDCVINLNLSYELRPRMHTLDAYISVVRKKITGFSLDDSERIPIYNKNYIWKNGKRNIIVVNSEGSWLSRTYDVDKWKQFIQYLKEQGNEILEIGRDPSKYLGIGKNCYARLTLDESVKLMLESDMYVGFDGALMHFAQSIGLPMFIIFGCTCPNYRIHNWDIAKVLWKNSDELECAGCHHRRLAPRKGTVCFHSKIFCLDFSVERVIETFVNAPFGNKPHLCEKNDQRILRIADVLDLSFY